jgi:hypothetical protein
MRTSHPPTTKGETVARAKRTDRAEARRRYRAEMADVEGADESVDAVAASSSTDAKPRQRSGSPQFSSPSGRIGMGAAFRQSIHPVNLREDLRSLPWLAIHTKALWLPSLITIVSAIAFAITQGEDFITRFGFAYFVQTPAIGSVFLAGFLAPRASWLLGAIVGLIAAIAYSAVIASVALGTEQTGLARDAMLSSIFLSPVMGALFAAAAAWYRRFLQLSNPNRGRRAEAKRTGNDGRTRNSGASKPTSARR